MALVYVASCQERTLLMTSLCARVKLHQNTLDLEFWMEDVAVDEVMYKLD